MERTRYGVNEIGIDFEDRRPGPRWPWWRGRGYVYHARLRGWIKPGAPGKINPEWLED